MAEGTDFGDTLQKEVAGIPVWAVGTGVGLLAVAAYYIFRGGGGSTLTQTVYDPTSETYQPEDSDPTNADYGLSNGPIGDFLSENPGYPGYPTTLPARGLPAPITNEQWGRQVIDQLLAKGSDPTLVTNAITKYLNGDALSIAEKAVVNLALTLFGALPEGAKPVLDAPTGKTPAPTGLRVTGSTASSISLAWNAVPGAVFYTVARRTPPGSYGVVVPKTTYTGLKPKTAYGFRVRAFTVARGWSDYSGEVIGRTT